MFNIFKKLESNLPRSTVSLKAGLIALSALSMATPAHSFALFPASSSAATPIGSCSLDAVAPGIVFAPPNRSIELRSGSTLLYRLRATYATSGAPINAIISSSGRDVFVGYPAIEAACGVTNFSVVNEIIPTQGIRFLNNGAQCGGFPCAYNPAANNVWIRTSMVWRDAGGTLRRVDKGIRQFLPGNDVEQTSLSAPATNPPAPTVAGGPAEVTGMTPFDVTVTFNEPVTDFDDLADLNVINGSVTTIGTDINQTTFTVTITPDGTGPVSIEVPAGVAQDLDNGLDNVVSNELVIPLADTTPPTPTLTSPVSTFSDTTPVTVTVQFDETVTGFDPQTVVGDLTVTGGTLIGFTAVDGDTYTLQIMPTAGSTDDITVVVPPSAAQDVTGNDSVVSNTLVIANASDETVTDLIEVVLEDDLLTTTRLIAQNASNISRRAADRLRLDRGQSCVAEINDLLRTSPVRFASDRFFIDASNNQLLDNIALALSKCDTADFMIEGHTDSDASDAYNITLSQNRVDAVKAALVRRGIANARLRTRGFGESRPIATNATEEGQALNRRVEFVLLDGEATVEPACSDGGPLGGNLSGGANDAGANLNGNFNREGYNCVTGEHTETWGAINVVRDDAVGTQGLASFGISKERQSGNTLRGRFIEGYVSRKEVETDDVEGTITGVGVHAGLYGAQANNGLVLSYYGSAALGVHAFDLSAATDVDGNYTYAGVFAGAAVTGERATGAVTIKPRVGIDLGYSQTLGSEISSTGTLDIDPATYARGYVELGLVGDTSGNAGTWEVAPRVFCEANDDDDAEACGFGGRVNYEGAMSAAGTQWNATFDYEAINDRQSATLAVARSQQILNGLGVSKSSFGAAATGALEAAQTVEFTW